MFKVKIGSIGFAVSGVMVPLMVILYFSGYLGEFLRIYAYIALHELMHGFAAVLCDCRVERVEITPGGLSLGLAGEVPDRRKKFFMLVMGPAANLILAGIFHVSGMPDAAQGNLALALFNLLPVRPLDGFEILTTVFRGDRAEKVIGIMSKVTIGAMACLIGYGFLIGRGSIISAITFLFLISLFSRSRMEGKVMKAKNLFDRRIQIQKKGYYEGRILTVMSSARIGKIMSKLGHDSFHFIFILDENFHLRGIVTEQQILNTIVDEKSDLTFGELLLK